MTVDYGFLWWIAEPLFKFLNYFHTVTGNWGMAIILLTLLVKGALYWVSAKGYRSMANMRRVAPAMKRIKNVTPMIGKNCPGNDGVVQKRRR